MKCISRIALATLGLLVTLGVAEVKAAVLVPLIDFSHANDFTGVGGKFFNAGTNGAGSLVRDTSDDGGVGAGGFIRLSTTANLSASAIYDTTPDSTPTNLFGDFIYDVDTRMSASGTAVLLYFRGIARNNALSVVLGLDSSGSSEEVRWFTGGDPGVPSAGTLAAGTGSNDTFFNTTLTYGNWIHLRLQVQNIVSGGTKTQATLTGYDSQSVFDNTTLKFTSTFLFNAGVNTAAGEIGFRPSSSVVGATSDIDNFTISTIPEPTCIGLLGASSGLLLFRRRQV